MDNLIYLSDIYQVSIDELVKENHDFPKTIAEDKKTILDRKANLATPNKDLYQNKDEGLILLILCIVSVLIPIVGILLPLYILWRNNKFNSLYKTIILVSLTVMLINLFNTFVLLNDNFFEPTSTKIYRVK
ncbi:hypothetical protein [Lentilactobacillus sp. SPB1-3]|uniref:Uncharacterized protein n=1 Tax=Lentilactobacillus terminaliae TaxID=3003483 RepID=A0ACD5DHF1_9LACO